MAGVRDQRGTSSAEYAVGTVAAAGFAGALILGWPWIEDLISQCLFWIAMLVNRAQLPVIPP